MLDIGGPRNIELRPNGLLVRGIVPYETWEAYGYWLACVEKAVHWLLGDWCNYGEAAYGEKYAQALDSSVFAYQTIANDAWVCSRIPISRRRENLSFGHHAEVAALDVAEQDHWLELAATGDGEAGMDGRAKPWSRDRLRHELRQAGLRLPAKVVAREELALVQRSAQEALALEALEREECEDEGGARLSLRPGEAAGADETGAARARAVRCPNCGFDVVVEGRTGA